MSAIALRSLADDPRSEQERLAWIADAREALLAAADQLEAVQEWTKLWPEWAVPGLRAILTADTAPQEDRDES